jgi:hypothetical protein
MIFLIDLLHAMPVQYMLVTWLCQAGMCGWENAEGMHTHTMRRADIIYSENLLIDIRSFPDTDALYKAAHGLMYMCASKLPGRRVP